MPLGEYGRRLYCLRDTKTLAEGLNDCSRLGRVSADLMIYFLAMGDYDRALASGHHALALATTLGDFALQAGRISASGALTWRWVTPVRR